MIIINKTKRTKMRVYTPKIDASKDINTILKAKSFLTAIVTINEVEKILKELSSINDDNLKKEAEGLIKKLKAKYK